MANETMVPADRAWDQASIRILEKSLTDGVDTCFTRMDAQRNQCGFGKSGVCCKICHMGPCRITPKAPRGVCGADADTIAARNSSARSPGGPPRTRTTAGTWSSS